MQPVEFTREREVVALQGPRGRNLWRKYKTLSHAGHSGARDTVEFIKHPVFIGSSGRLYVGQFTAGASGAQMAVGVKEMRIAPPGLRPKPTKAHVQNHDQYRGQLKPVMLSSFDNIGSEVAVMQAMDPTSVVSWGKTGKYAYVVMKLHYGDLNTAIADLFEVRDTMLPGIADAHIARFLLREGSFALKDLHDKQLVHGDLKPENMLFDRSALTVRLADFGMTRATGHAVAFDGTPDYFAHEQRHAWLADDRDARLDDKADVQALALSVIALTTTKLMMPPLPERRGTYEVHTLRDYERYYRSYKTWKRDAQPLGLPHHLYTLEPAVRRYFDLEKHMFSLDEQLAELLWRMLDPNPRTRPNARQVLENPIMQPSPRYATQIRFAANQLEPFNTRIRGYLGLLEAQRNVRNKASVAPDTNVPTCP